MENNEYNDYDNDMCYGDICTFYYDGFLRQGTLSYITYTSNDIVYEFRCERFETPVIIKYSTMYSDSVALRNHSRLSRIADKNTPKQEMINNTEGENTPKLHQRLEFVSSGNSSDLNKLLYDGWKITSISACGSAYCYVLLEKIINTDVK